MIYQQFLFFFSVLALVGTIKIVKSRTNAQVFEYVPVVVIVYFLMMVIGNLRLLDKNLIESLNPIKLYLLSSMILFLLTKSNIRQIYKLKTKLLFSFITASATIMFSFIIMWFLFNGFFKPDAYKAFGALCGCWIGGMANMIAVAESIGCDNSSLGFCMISDSVNYAVWLAFLLFLVPYKDKFNAWTKATEVDIGVQNSESNSSKTSDILSTFFGLFLPFIIIYASGFLPKSGFTNQTFWSVLISTFVGTIASFTRLSHNNISNKIGFEFLYLVVAITAVGASFDDFSKAPLYIFATTFVLLCHLILMVSFAKIFKIDLFSISVSSLANIGGVASAPILAANYSANLVSIGVMMAMLGYIIGTFCGIFTTFVMSLI
jgi:uncharacterized membrane protein